METAICRATERRRLILSVVAAIVGGCLVLDCARSSSATYDESAYLQIGCRWWRTGDQERITRMGSPLTFWKLQQVPTLWMLDRVGLGTLIDDPANNESRLLTILRFGAVWIWLAALSITTLWARRLYGSKAMVFASWLFALSPNLVAHGSLLTMEMPIIASCAGVGLLFTLFLQTRCRRAFIAAGMVAGLAFSCKFTAVLIPPVCGLAWLIQTISRRETSVKKGTLWVTCGMTGFCLILILANLLVTDCSLLPLSEQIGLHPTLTGRSKFLSRIVEIPIPQDWVGFATQIRHQRSGGPSYLFGETRMTGWWYYYPVALFVKIPPVFWVLVGVRLVDFKRRDALIPITIGVFMAITIAGSSRNYGLRYLFPISTLAIVWLSALAEGTRLKTWVAWGCVVGYGLASVSSHPRELAYFPGFVGGAEGGRRILSDSNLDWGQGLRDLARLQRENPEYCDLTLFYFGDTDPKRYNVAGITHVIDASNQHPTLPARFSARSRFVAVSASLEYGPWGPHGYFARLQGLIPRGQTPDWTISVYEWADQ